MLKYHRIPVFASAVLFTYLIVHLLGTCRFLMEQFFSNEITETAVRLDMSMWRNTTYGHEKIPRFIHQIWISSKQNKSIDSKFTQAAQSCKDRHSDYNYTLWTDKNILDWLTENYPWFITIYRSYSYDMQRVDAMKYLLLYHYGGIYIDLDIECLSTDIVTAMLPSTPIENEEDEPEIIFHMGTEGISANTDIMAAKKFHPFFKLAITRLKQANRWFYFYHLTIILSAGPTYLHGIYRQFPFKERFYFFPNELLWGKLAIGVGGGTWYGRDTLLILFIQRNRMLMFILLLLIILIFLKSIKRKRTFRKIY